MRDHFVAVKLNQTCCYIKLIRITFLYNVSGVRQCDCLQSQTYFTDEELFLLKLAFDEILKQAEESGVGTVFLFKRSFIDRFLNLRKALVAPNNGHLNCDE